MGIGEAGIMANGMQVPWCMGNVSKVILWNLCMLGLVINAVELMQGLVILWNFHRVSHAVKLPSGLVIPFMHWLNCADHST